MVSRVDARGCVVSRKNKGLASTGVPLNFLLGCSERALGGFELQRLAEVADLRNELHRVLDRLIDQMAQAALAAWFRRTDTATIKRALENPEDILLWAKEQIRDGQRSEEELEELFPQASLPLARPILPLRFDTKRGTLPRGNAPSVPSHLTTTPSATASNPSQPNATGTSLMMKLPGHSVISIRTILPRAGTTERLHR